MDPEPQGQLSEHRWPGPTQGVSHEGGGGRVTHINTTLLLISTLSEKEHFI